MRRVNGMGECGENASLEIFLEGPDFNISYAIYSICYVNVTASESISITYRHAVFLPERVGTGGGTI
jgi:hypothetical protein